MASLAEHEQHWAEPVSAAQVALQVMDEIQAEGSLADYPAAAVGVSEAEMPWLFDQHLVMALVRVSERP